MNIKEKFDSIDQTKVNPKVVAILKKMEDKSKKFSNEDANKIIEPSLDNLLAKLKSSLPEAIKKKETPKKVVAKKEAPKKVVKKKTNNRGQNSIYTKAKASRKEGESWVDAVAREKGETKKAKKETEKQTKKVNSEISKELGKLKDFIKSNKLLKGFSKSDLSRDAKRTAKASGKRISKGGWKNQHGTSKAGNVYYEKRENRSDRLAPNYPKGMPLLEKGGSLSARERFTDSDKDKLSYDFEVFSDRVEGEKGKILGTFNDKGQLVMKGDKTLKNPLVKWLQQNSFVSNEEWQKLEQGGDLQMLNIANSNLFAKGGETSAFTMNIVKGHKKVGSGKDSVNIDNVDVSMAKGGKVDEIADALFDYNSNRKGKIKTSFGDKTITGLRAMISNKNYSDDELAQAIFEPNQKRGRIETDYGTKTLKGVTEMISQVEKFEGGAINDRNVWGVEVIYSDVKGEYKGYMQSIKDNLSKEEAKKLADKINKERKYNGRPVKLAVYEIPLPFENGGEIEYHDDGEPKLTMMQKANMLKPLEDYGYFLKIGNYIYYYDDNKKYETFKMGYEDGGETKKNLSRDQKFFNKAESWERAYSKGKAHRKGYMADGGGLPSGSFQSYEQSYLPATNTPIGYAKGGMTTKTKNRINKISQKEFGKDYKELSDTDKYFVDDADASIQASKFMAKGGAVNDRNVWGVEVIYSDVKGEYKGYMQSIKDNLSKEEAKKLADKINEERKYNGRPVKLAVYEIPLPFAEGGEVISLKQDDGRPFLVFIGKEPNTEKGKKSYKKDGFYIDNQMGFNGLITSYFKDKKTLKENISSKYHNQIMADGGETKKNLSRDQKFFNKSESWERAYSKGKSHRKGYKTKMADGGEISEEKIIEVNALVEKFMYTINVDDVIWGQLKNVRYDEDDIEDKLDAIAKIRYKLDSTTPMWQNLVGLSDEIEQINQEEDEDDDYADGGEMEDDRDSLINVSTEIP
jgi:hypothetical protein